MTELEEMKPGYIALLAFGGLVLLVLLFVGARVLGIADTKVFGVVDQNAQREVYENTKAYRDGIRRDFDELSLAYAKATPEEKPAILAVLRHRTEGVPPELVPDDVKRLLGGAP
jgi:hypothetical protein